MSAVIVGVDESHHAEVALRWAVAYGAAHTLPVRAVMAWDFLDQHHLGDEPEFDPGYSAQAAHAVLAELISRAVGADHQVVSEVVLDRPGPALVSAAAGADLLVVGARGLGGFRGLLLGSVSHHVLRSATCPVAVVRSALEESNDQLGAIVVGIDGSDPSLRALQWAVAHAAAHPVPRQPQVVAVHVWSPPYSVTGFYAKFPDPAQLEQTARQRLAKLLATVDQSSLATPIQAVVQDGRPSAGLLEAAAEASLVVVGSRGRRARAGVLLGSVSEQVAQHAGCPVVVVPFRRR